MKAIKLSTAFFLSIFLVLNSGFVVSDCLNFVYFSPLPWLSEDTEAVVTVKLFILNFVFSIVILFVLFCIIFGCWKKNASNKDSRVRKIMSWVVLFLVISPTFFSILLFYSELDFRGDEYELIPQQHLLQYTEDRHFILNPLRFFYKFDFIRRNFNEAHCQGL